MAAENSTQCALTSSPGVRARRPKFDLANTTIERPSGVSSARLDSCAASASCSFVTPVSGTKSDACRLPSVMVPVLSSSSVLTSPAASTARPDMASTLRCTSRSMPAMPMADSSAPMVVGIRQTRSATMTMPLTPSPVSANVSGTPGLLALEKIASGCRVATAKMKMIVSAANRMFSAISFGVFCRLAPSTRAIIRSMKLSPGFWVILTTMRSDSTVVPPVTAERSPPDSRMTGADSPVMADSSTEAMPSSTSPSPGMTWPASTTTMSPWRSSGAAISSSLPGLPGSHPVRRRAMVSALVFRSDSACALPRPSATASARLANTTVSQSQNTISQPNQLGVRTRQDGAPDGADLDDEHDRVAPQRARVELAQRVGQGGQEHLGVEQTALHLFLLGARRRSGLQLR